MNASHSARKRRAVAASVMTMCHVRAIGLSLRLLCINQALLYHLTPCVCARAVDGRLQ